MPGRREGRPCAEQGHASPGVCNESPCGAATEPRGRFGGMNAGWCLPRRGFPGALALPNAQFSRSRLVERSTANRHRQWTAPRGDPRSGCLGCRPGLPGLDVGQLKEGRGVRLRQVKHPTNEIVPERLGLDPIEALDGPGALRDLDGVVQGVEEPTRGRRSSDAVGVGLRHGAAADPQGRHELLGRASTAVAEVEDLRRRFAVSGQLAPLVLFAEAHDRGIAQFEKLDSQGGQLLDRSLPHFRVPPLPLQPTQVEMKPLRLNAPIKARLRRAQGPPDGVRHQDAGFSAPGRRDIGALPPLGSVRVRN